MVEVPGPDVTNDPTFLKEHRHKQKSNAVPGFFRKSIESPKGSWWRFSGEIFRENQLSCATIACIVEVGANDLDIMSLTDLPDLIH